MGEIKSTLDIIMERTKGLTMSEEEKREFKARETAGKVRGLIQKCLDGIIDLDRFRIELEAVKKEMKDRSTMERLVREESVDRIEFGGDNSLLFHILESEAGLDVHALEMVVQKFEELLSREKAIRESALLFDLKKRGVSGSAVIPNINADAGWKEYLGRMKKALGEEVRMLGKGASKKNERA